MLRVASAALERPREARGGGADGVEGIERLPDEPVPSTPAGKLRHAVFFFLARVDLGRRLGWRGVYPPAAGRS